MRCIIHKVEGNSKEERERKYTYKYNLHKFKKFFDIIMWFIPVRVIRIFSEKNKFFGMSINYSLCECFMLDLSKGLFLGLMNTLDWFTALSLCTVRQKLIKLG